MSSTTWPSLTGANPGHAQSYIERWERLEREGTDIVGEARLIDAMARRSSRILDAGAGTGRLSVYLDAQGHHVTAVDIDPDLVAYAQRRYSEQHIAWHVGDLSVDSGEGAVPEGPFDIIFSAGNVLAFIPDEAHQRALHVLASRLAPQGRLVVGFGLNRGRSAEEFFAAAQRAGLVQEQAFASWDLKPFGPEEEFLVAVLRHD